MANEQKPADQEKQPSPTGDVPAGQPTPNDGSASTQGNTAGSGPAETAHGAQSNDPGQTFGQKAVGASFNPSKNPAVDNIKELAAKFVDALNDIRAKSEDGEVKRMASIAITDAQQASMWAVKAATWGS